MTIIGGNRPRIPRLCGTVYLQRQSRRNLPGHSRGHFTCAGTSECLASLLRDIGRWILAVGCWTFLSIGSKEEYPLSNTEHPTSNEPLKGGGGGGSRTPVLNIYPGRHYVRSWWLGFNPLAARQQATAGRAVQCLAPVPNDGTPGPACYMAFIRMRQAAPARNVLR